ncbi:hypothetical protein TG4357_02997 [Thalassovita gelatinovora]|uniref:Integral membrane protein n=1 Tax=Thalassovita gelatinovora TaxID=53501 RepID=A0A0P1G3R6_THAGE|nr:hypothetical protein [Thalassovita gelatinovora]QIZ81982.1 hypothetical protein HFZ77_16615 [Thalassovita gelatinovora]CUH67420.1 hypothetical protein TG4357_02997 [Thalassovita gelatinovora]SEP74402.1 hypothetical protein SAMN04488043_101262 [Thalassovita gelatinovora]
MNLNLFRLAPMAMVALITLPVPVMAENAAVFAPIELAQSNAPQGDRQGGRPPREAFVACESKSKNDRCEIVLKDGATLNGTCRQPPAGRDDAMLCVPAGAAPKG